MTGNVIERSTFDVLKDSVGDDFIGELVSTFGEEAPIMIANMRQALSAGEADVFRREAHSMKTNADTFGAGDLAELAKKLEQLGRESQLSQVGDQVDMLETLYQAAYSEMERLGNGGE